MPEPTSESQSTKFDAERKAAWLKQIRLDTGLTGAALRIAMCLAFDFINNQSWLAWPSLETLANETGLRDSTTREALKLLSDRGHLAILHARGRGKVNRYRPMLQKTAAKAAGFQANKTAAPGKEKPPLQREENRRQSGDRTYVGTMEGNPHSRAAREEGEIPPASSSSKERALARASTRQNDPEFEAQFQQFWTHYPKHAGEDEARIAFRAALKKTPFVEIMAGVHRYAAERADQPSKYTAHPANWLRAGRWKDEPQQSYDNASAPLRPAMRQRPNSTAEILGALSDQGDMP